MAKIKRETYSDWQGVETTSVSPHIIAVINDVIAENFNGIVTKVLESVDSESIEIPMRIEDAEIFASYYMNFISSDVLEKVQRVTENVLRQLMRPV